MDICCDALYRLCRAPRRFGRDGFARGCPEEAGALKIAEVSSHAGPSSRPWEALQMYWYVHIGVITGANTWDSFNPGRLTSTLISFYKKELEEGTLTREDARSPVLLGQVQQPAGAARWASHSPRAVLHGLRQHQHGRAQARRLVRVNEVFTWC